MLRLITLLVALVFTLTAAFSYFPQVVTGAPYHPMHPSYPTGQLVEFPEAPWGGVGPWMVTELSTGEQTVLEPNPNYYGDAPLVDYINDEFVASFAIDGYEFLVRRGGEVEVMMTLTLKDGALTVKQTQNGMDTTGTGVKKP